MVKIPEPVSLLKDIFRYWACASTPEVGQYDKLIKMKIYPVIGFSSAA
jgi:hypothetical protein